MKKKAEVQPDEDVVPDPPDGGWGWLVAIGAHVAQALSVGILTSCGPILVEWLHYFDTSTAVTTWVFSLTALVGAIFTPVAAGLTAKFGSCPVVIVGGVFSAVGFLLSSFAQSIQQLFIFMGIIMGIGFGLIYAPSLLIIGIYFKKHYTFANGIAFLGICTGQLVFSPLFVFLNSIFGWRASLRIFAAISANVIACGALFRPLRRRSPRKGRTRIKDHAYTEIDNRDEVANETTASAELQEVDANTQEDYQEKQERAKRFLSALEAVGRAFAVPVLRKNSKFAIYLICTFCLGTAYFIPLVHLVNKVVVGGMTEVNTDAANFAKVVFGGMTEVNADADAAKVNAAKANAAWLMSAIGAGSFLGRGFHGWFVDRGYISAQTFMFICILFALVETVLFVLTNNFTILIVVCFVFGINTGVVVPLTFVIPRLLVKQEQVPSVIGLTLLIHALGNAVGPVLGGFLFDFTGDYVIPFCVAAGIYLLSAIFLLPVCHFLWRQHKYGPLVLTNVQEINHRSGNHVQNSHHSSENHVQNSTTV